MNCAGNGNNQPLFFKKHSGSKKEVTDRKKANSWADNVSILPAHFKRMQNDHPVKLVAMKKRSITISMCMAVLLTAACKKENDIPSFSPAGYWRGNAFIYHTAILNRADGTSRLYYVIPGTDTANALLKREGTYTVAGGSFRGIYFYNDTIFLETYAASANLMSGLLISSLTGEAIPYDLRKQP
jgi:hypothetical protein